MESNDIDYKNILHIRKAIYQDTHSRLLSTIMFSFNAKLCNQTNKILKKYDDDYNVKEEDRKYLNC